MNSASERLFDPALLFRLQLHPVTVPTPFGQRDWQLPPEAELPNTGAGLSGQKSFATLKLAVSDTGLFLSVAVTGKRQLPWCRESRLEDSDGLHLLIDTRNSRDVHRATRYCHRFVFSPMGRGPKSEQPFSGWAPINRARENSRPPAEKLLFTQANVAQNGYEMWAALHWQALSGFDRADFPVLGFYAIVLDRELGWQTLGLGPPLLVLEDPSLWCELALN